VGVRKRYYGGPIETHQRSFERCNPRPPTSCIFSGQKHRNREYFTVANIVAVPLYSMVVMCDDSQSATRRSVAEFLSPMLQLDNDSSLLQNSPAFTRTATEILQGRGVVYRAGLLDGEDRKHACAVSCWTVHRRLRAHLWWCVDCGKQNYTRSVDVGQWRWLR